MSDYETILALLIGLFAGLWIGWRANDHFHKTMIGAILKEAGVTQADMEKIVLHAREQLTEVDPDHPEAIKKVPVKVEQHGNQLFAYRADNNEFMAQGTNKDELIKAIALRHNKDFTIVIEQGAELLKA
jgi:hypothetical protein